MVTAVLLVRHPPVARAWRGRCYGASDMGWSREGAAMADGLAERLARLKPALVVHSGLRRTERLARMIGAPLRADPRWRERDFGAWEGRSWHAIWRESGDLMDRMVTHPDDFRPGGGETTATMAARACAAWRDLPPGDLPPDRVVVVIAHGGSIAAVRHHLTGGTSDLAALIPACGDIVRIERPGV